MRFFCEWMLAMWIGARWAISDRQQPAGRAAQRRTIAPLSAAEHRICGAAGGPAPPRQGRAQHRDLLAGDRALARGGARARNRRGELLRHGGARVSAFTLAFQVPNLVSNLFANAALSAAFVPVFTDLLAAGPQARGLPAGLDPVLDHADRARRGHRVLHPRRGRDHAAVHRARLQRAARRADGGPLAGAVPGRAAARAERPARRDPAVLRPLHRSRRSRRRCGTS